MVGHTFFGVLGFTTLSLLACGQDPASPSTSTRDLGPLTRAIRLPTGDQRADEFPVGRVAIAHPARRGFDAVPILRFADSCNASIHR